MQVAIAIGVIIIAIVIVVNYYLDQTQLSGQRFGDQLAQIQLDLKNETQSFDAHLTQYKNGHISKDQMLNITDNHITAVQNILPRYEQLRHQNFLCHRCNYSNSLLKPRLKATRL